MPHGESRVLTSNSWQPQRVNSPFWGNWSAGKFGTVRGSMHAQLLMNLVRTDSQAALAAGSAADPAFTASSIGLAI